jgi:hypothetical protein
MSEFDEWAQQQSPAVPLHQPPHHGPAAPTCSLPRQATAILGVVADVAGTAATFLPARSRRTGTAVMNVLLLLEGLALVCAVVSLSRDVAACRSVLEGGDDGAARAQCYAGVSGVAALVVVACGVALAAWVCKSTQTCADPDVDSATDCVEEDCAALKCEDHDDGAPIV